MLGVVCKTYDGVEGLETYDKEGMVDKTSGIHGLGRTIGKFLDGRFTVFCLENIRCVFIVPLYFGLYWMDTLTL
jgi:hypothetical protein